VLYHAFNGVRIILIDFWKKGAGYQKSMFAIVIAVTIIAFIPFAYFILRPVLGATVAWFWQIPGLTVASH
jgi:succinate dehydrogenase / fumarate reductase cytochrome b subunit